MACFLLDSTRRRWWNTAREHDSPTARCLICYHHPARLCFNRLSAIGKQCADYRTRDRRNAQGCWRVDIWTFGAPPRKYRVLGVINDTRGGGVIPMAGHYSGIGAKVKQYGGNAAIEMSSRSQYVGTASIANATTTTSGGFYRDRIPLRKCCRCCREREHYFKHVRQWNVCSSV